MWCKVGLVSLFNGISTLFRLFNAKAILLEEQYYLTHSWEDKGVHTFPKGICPKVNIIARLENERAYYDSAVHRFNHYTTRTPPCKVGLKRKTPTKSISFWEQGYLKLVPFPWHLLLEEPLSLGNKSALFSLKKWGICCFGTKPSQWEITNFEAFHQTTSL